MFFNLHKVTVVLPVALATAIHANPRAASQRIDFTSLRQTVLEELQQTNTPGAAVAVIVGDRVVFSEGFGVASIETGDKVTADTVFHIGSLTKMFTAAALVSVAAESRFDLYVPIGRFVPNLNPKQSRIRTHQLLSQTAGLKDIPGGDGRHDEAALAEFVHSWGDDYFMLPGAGVFSYSNPGYALAGYVLEKLLMRPYADCMEERLFHPLGMKRTTLRPHLARTYALAAGHTARGRERPVVVNPMADDTRLWPAGYMFSSASDIARFLVALLNRGKVDGTQPLPAEVSARMLRPYVRIPTNTLPNGKYAYGLFARDYRGLQMFEHGGELPGYSSEVKMIPDRRAAVVILNNKEGARFNKTFERAFDLLPGIPANRPGALPKRNLPMSQAEMEKLSGRYSNRWTMEVFARDRSLYLNRFGVDLPISKIGPRLFSVTPEGAKQPQTFIIVPEIPRRKVGYMQMFVWAFKKEKP